MLWSLLRSRKSDLRHGGCARGEDVLEGRTWEAGAWVGAWCSPPDCEGGDWQLAVAGESGWVNGVCEPQEVAGLLTD